MFHIPYRKEGHENIRGFKLWRPFGGNGVEGGGEGAGRVIADVDADANSPIRPEDIFIKS